MIPAATTQVTSMEFVTVNSPRVKSGAAFRESASCFSAGRAGSRRQFRAIRARRKTSESEQGKNAQQKRQ